MGRKDPNIVHGMRRVVLEDVGKRHRTVCLDCAAMPEVRRLLVMAGSGMSQTREIRCIGCGSAWLNTRIAEFERAVIRLRTGTGEVRV